MECLVRRSRASAPTGAAVNSQGRKPLDAGRAIHSPGRATQSQKGDAPVPQSFVSLHFHVVFSTKNRQPMIGAEFVDRLYEYIGVSFKDEFKSPLIRYEIVFDETYLWS